MRSIALFQVQRIAHSDHFEYVLQGAPSENAWLELIRQICTDAETAGYRCAMINTFGLTARVETMTRYWVGIEIGRTLGPRVRVGIYSPPEQINHFMENVAHNCGGMLKPSDDRAALLAWLRQID